MGQIDPTPFLERRIPGYFKGCWELGPSQHQHWEAEVVLGPTAEHGHREARPPPRRPSVSTSPTHVPDMSSGASTAGRTLVSWQVDYGPPHNSKGQVGSWTPMPQPKCPITQLHPVCSREVRAVLHSSPSLGSPVLLVQETRVTMAGGPGQSRVRTRCCMRPDLLCLWTSGYSCRPGEHMFPQAHGLRSLMTTVAWPLTPDCPTVLVTGRTGAQDLMRHAHSRAGVMHLVRICAPATLGKEL